ncbi:unnamed protein product [Closterium sp. Naga37s-1]|nr:unnamed protein product [Closterium sp. Naga37s-1]
MESESRANEMNPRGYEAALVALSGLISPQKRADGRNWADDFALMRSYVKVGLWLSQAKVLDLEGPVDQLSIIHVAGTKGKARNQHGGPLHFTRVVVHLAPLSQGSTCAMAESMLRASGHTTGLFTSPHLVDVRERFRLNGEMVPVDTFLQHFWWCYDRCKEAASSPSSPIPMPAYFRFLTLLALRIFTHTQVDVAILEVGIGGRFDATNIVKRPAVCGVSSLGFDHMELLGNTLALIAGEKAGIFKAGVPAVTAPQEEEAMEVLRQRAAELQIPLKVARPWHEVAPGVRVGLAGRHQQVNASLAVSLCRQWAIRSGREEEARAVDEALANKTLPLAYIKGLGGASWPGSKVEAKTPVRVLLFNCMPERDPHTLMTQLLRTLERKGLSLHRALFVPSLSSYTALLPSPSSSAPSSAYLPSSDSTGLAPNLTSQSTSSGTDASGTRQSSSLGQSSLVWQLAMQQTWEQLQQQPLHAVNFAAAASDIGAAPAAAPAPASAAGSGGRSVDSIPASHVSAGKIIPKYRVAL